MVNGPSVDTSVEWRSVCLHDAPFRSMPPPLHWPCTHSDFSKYPSSTFQHRVGYAAVMESLVIIQRSTGFRQSRPKVPRNRVVPHRSHLWMSSNPKLYWIPLEPADDRKIARPSRCTRQAAHAAGCRAPSRSRGQAPA